MLPWLEAKIKHSWLDPRKAKGTEEFFYEYVTSWGWAQAAQEIIEWVEKMKGQKEYLEKKKKGEITNNFAIGK